MLLSDVFSKHNGAIINKIISDVDCILLLLFNIRYAYDIVRFAINKDSRINYVPK